MQLSEWDGELKWKETWSSGLFLPTECRCSSNWSCNLHFSSPMQNTPYCKYQIHSQTCWAYSFFNKFSNCPDFIALMLLCSDSLPLTHQPHLQFILMETLALPNQRYFLCFIYPSPILSATWNQIGFSFSQFWCRCYLTTNRFIKCFSHFLFYLLITLVIWISVELTGLLVKKQNVNTLSIVNPLANGTRTQNLIATKIVTVEAKWKNIYFIQCIPFTSWIA